MHSVGGLNLRITVGYCINNLFAVSLILACIGPVYSVTIWDWQRLWTKLNLSQLKVPPSMYWLLFSFKAVCQLIQMSRVSAAQWKFFQVHASAEAFFLLLGLCGGYTKCVLTVLKYYSITLLCCCTLDQTYIDLFCHVPEFIVIDNTDSPPPVTAIFFIFSLSYPEWRADESPVVFEKFTSTFLLPASFLS